MYGKTSATFRTGPFTLDHFELESAEPHDSARRLACCQPHFDCPLFVRVCHHALPVHKQNNGWVIELFKQCGRLGQHGCNVLATTTTV